MLASRFSLVVDVHEAAPIDEVESCAAGPFDHGNTSLGRKPFPRSVALFFLPSAFSAVFRRLNSRHRISV